MKIGTGQETRKAYSPPRMTTTPLPDTPQRYSRTMKNGRLQRELDGRPYPDDVDPNWFDEIFPPLQSDVLHHALSEADDFWTVMQLAKEVLKELSRKRQEVEQLTSSIESLKSSHRMQVEHLQRLNADLADQLRKMRGKILDR